MTSSYQRTEFLLLLTLTVCLFGIAACSRREQSGSQPDSDDPQHRQTERGQNRSRETDAQLKKLLKRSRSASVATSKDREQFFNEALTLLQQDGLTNRTLDTVTLVAHNLYRHDEPRLADALKRIGAGIRKRGEKRFTFKASRLEGIARRLRSPGTIFELTGTTLDGKSFDWNAYKGKVVLIEYWETRCVPCVKEFDNIKSNYVRFHDRGFELVSISMDVDRDKVRRFIQKHKIPGTALFDSRGYGHPMAVKYGITTVPTVFLIDRDGKVVSRSAHGPRLQRLLSQLLSDR